jgi:hypothetical protein
MEIGIVLAIIGIILSAVGFVFGIVTLLSYIDQIKEKNIRKKHDIYLENPKINGDYCVFMFLMGFLCSIKKELIRREVIRNYRELRLILPDHPNQWISILVRYCIKYEFMRTQDDHFFITKEGEKYCQTYVERQYSLFENFFYNNLPKNELQFLFVKFIIEKMPSEERKKRLPYIAKYISQRYSNICWKAKINQTSVILPFHLLIDNHVDEILCKESEDLFHQNIKYDMSYYEFYKERSTAIQGGRSVDRRVYNGSVYRLLDWTIGKDNKGILFLGLDLGYIDFQSTCGKIRNEIDLLIPQYDSVSIQEFTAKLHYRNDTLHSTDDLQDISSHLKNRVVKIGIETSVIIVDKNANNSLENPRVPVIFRNDSVAEYPGFTMVVPSGAYQASLLVDLSEKDKEGFHAKLQKRMDWKLSVIRELGEELFGIKELDELNIEKLKDLKTFIMSKEIFDHALLKKQTGFGIDLYLGSGNMLVTLILDYAQTLAIIDKYCDNNRSKEFVTIKERFKNMHNCQCPDVNEGKVFLYKLDQQLFDRLAYDFADIRVGEPVSPQIFNTKLHKEFCPMIPSGIISLVFANIEYESLKARSLERRPE